MKKKKIYILLFSLLIVVAVLATPCAKKMLDIDKCLDRGGAWDYKHNVCVSSKDQDSINECINKCGQWDFESKQCIFPR